MREKSDFIEIEIKVHPRGRHDRLVELAQAAAPPGWRMVRKPHVAFFDLYFDTPTLALTKTGDHLRARFDTRSFKGKGRYKLFFKERGEAQPQGLWLARREIRSDMKRVELLRFSRDKMPGLAATQAYASIAQAGGAPPLVPVLAVSTFRRYFTMRSPNPKDTDYLNMSIEQSTAFAARDINVEFLIDSGFIDGRNPLKTYSFELAEAELTVENVPAADVMFRELASALAAEFELTTTPKYERCLDELGISAENVV